MELILFMILGYALGSIPFSYLIPKLTSGIDIREHGSGSTGATNVFRNTSKLIGSFSFAGDFLKGVLASTLGYHFGGELGALTAGSFAMIGHCHPVWIGFKGGKGVAVSGGVILGLNPLLFVLVLTVQIILMFTTRIVSLASIIASLAFPLLSFLTGSSILLTSVACFMSAFVIYRHRANITRLRNGTESRIGSKNK